MAALEVRQASHRYGDDPVLKDISFSVAAGEIVCLLGASGSGKSTLLRLIAGLEPLQSGELWFNGQCLARPGAEPPPEARRFGLVFQDHVLFPHLNVAENIAFGLSQLPAASRAERVAAALAGVGLSGLQERYPHTLSGGQQQRVALARAIAPQPDVMLLDEPFASVDSTLRRKLREDARRVLKANGAPTIIVTHDADEALELADRIALIYEGALVQLDRPEQLCAKPANRFAAELFLRSDGIRGTVTDQGVETAFGTAALDTDGYVPGQACIVVARPEAARVKPAEPGSAEIADIRFLGDRYLILIESGSERLRVFEESKPTLQIGDAVSVDFAQGQTLLYNQE